MFSALIWLRSYKKSWLIQDLTAALIVTVLLIPQSLAYAMLAGVPPEVGLYASILPLIAYALFGSSRTLSVGPVAVISLMTATTVGSVVSDLGVSYISAASTLAFMSGAMLIILGLLKLGFVTNFLSHTVISGFISASAIIIALSQVKYILAVDAHGGTLTDLLPALLLGLSKFHGLTFVLGLGAILFLLLGKYYAVSLLEALNIKRRTAEVLSKMVPIVAVVLSIVLVFGFDLDQRGVDVTGVIPHGLPTIGAVLPSFDLLSALFLPAVFISIIGYVESISVAKTLAAKRRQKVDANKELLGLGAANIASFTSGGFPVTGGFSRSIVNYNAGAVTQAASVFTALGIALTLVFLTPVLYYLPKAILAATIIVAVVSLIDFSIFKETWKFSKSDFSALIITIVVTLLMGVEVGVSCGVLVSIALHLYRTSVPHIAEVGLIEGTEHFRNIVRHKVKTYPEVLILRPDESLFFANASFLENRIQAEVIQRECLKHIVLQFSAVNEVDFSALEVLDSISSQLFEQNILLHLSEVKGPVMDKLKLSGFLDKLSGRVFVTSFKGLQDCQ